MGSCPTSPSCRPRARSRLPSGATIDHDGDVGQARVRGDPLASARECAHDPALERGGGDDRARSRGRGRPRAIRGSARSMRPTARTCSRPCPRRPTLARSRRYPASPNGMNPSRSRWRASRARRNGAAALAGLRSPAHGQRAGANRWRGAAGGRNRARAQLRRRRSASASARTLRLAAAGGPVELPVVGTAISPSQPRYPRSNPGLAGSRATRSSGSSPIAAAGPGPSDPAHRPRRRPRLRRACHGIAAARSRPRRHLGRPARGGAARRTANRDHPHDLHDRAAHRRVRGRRDPRRRPRHRAAPRDRAAQGRRPHAAPGHCRVRARVRRLGLIAVVIGFTVGALLAPRLAAPSAETLLGSPTTAVSPWHLLVASCPVLLVLDHQRALVVPAQHPLQRPAGDRRPGRPLRLPSRSRLARSDRAPPLPLRSRSASGPARQTPPRHPARRRDRASPARRSSSRSRCSQPRRRTGGEVSEVPRRAARRSSHSRRRAARHHRTTLARSRSVRARAHPRRRRPQDHRPHPQAVASSLVGAHAALALLAASLSIPAGIGLYVDRLRGRRGSSEDRVIAPWWWLALVPIASVLIVSPPPASPARLATRIPTAEAPATNDRGAVRILDAQVANPDTRQS